MHQQTETETDIDSLPPAFFRWLVARMLRKEFFGVLGKSIGYRHVAARVMHGEWYHPDPGGPSMILCKPTAKPEECFECAVAEWKHSLVTKEKAT